MNKMFNNEIFTSPDKCIEECDKQIEFAKGMMIYLEQYINQMQAIKTMASSAKALQEVNPFNMMNNFMEMMSSSADAMSKSMQKIKPKQSEEVTDTDKNQDA